MSNTNHVLDLCLVFFLLSFGLRACMCECLSWCEINCCVSLSFASPATATIPSRVANTPTFPSLLSPQFFYHHVYYFISGELFVYILCILMPLSLFKMILQCFNFSRSLSPPLNFHSHLSLPPRNILKTFSHFPSTSSSSSSSFLQPSHRYLNPLYFHNSLTRCPPLFPSLLTQNKGEIIFFTSFSRLQKQTCFLFFFFFSLPT